MMEQTTELSQIKLYIASKKSRDTLICRICQKLFSGKSRRKEIDQHIKRHFGKRIGRKVSSDLKQTLSERLHGNKETEATKTWQDDTKAYYPEIIDESLNDFRIQQDHLKNANVQRPVINDYCRICTLQYSRKYLQVYSSLYDLTNHVIKSHQHVSSLFNCPDCSIGFSHEISLSLHHHFSHGEGQYGVPYPGNII